MTTTRRPIVAGNWKMNTTVPEATVLAAGVREAVAALRAEGVVVTRQGVGAFVAADAKRRPFRLDPDGMESLGEAIKVMELRRAVEIEAAGLAAERGTPAQIDDVGRAVNPLILHGQAHGGIVQGAGQVLMEHCRYDEAGQLLSGSFMDYAMPRASDLCMIEVGSHPVPTKTNPIGAKGAGEAGCVGAMPAVANALVDALSDYGIQHIEMPATAERVWRIINGGKPA